MHLCAAINDYCFCFFCLSGSCKMRSPARVNPIFGAHGSIRCQIWSKSENAKISKNRTKEAESEIEKGLKMSPLIAYLLILLQKTRISSIFRLSKSFRNAVTFLFWKFSCDLDSCSFWSHFPVAPVLNRNYFSTKNVVEKRSFCFFFR